MAGIPTLFPTYHGMTWWKHDKLAAHPLPPQCTGQENQRLLDVVSALVDWNAPEIGHSPLLLWIVFGIELSNNRRFLNKWKLNFNFISFFLFASLAQVKYGGNSKTLPHHGMVKAWQIGSPPIASPMYRAREPTLTRCRQCSSALVDWNAPEIGHSPLLLWTVFE